MNINRISSLGNGEINPDDSNQQVRMKVLGLNLDLASSEDAGLINRESLNRMDSLEERFQESWGKRLLDTVREFDTNPNRLQSADLHILEDIFDYANLAIRHHGSFEKAHESYSAREKDLAYFWEKMKEKVDSEIQRRNRLH